MPTLTAKNNDPVVKSLERYAALKMEQFNAEMAKKGVRPHEYEVSASGEGEQIEYVITPKFDNPALAAFASRSMASPLDKHGDIVDAGDSTYQRITNESPNVVLKLGNRTPEEMVKALDDLTHKERMNGDLEANQEEGVKAYRTRLGKLAERRELMQSHTERGKKLTPEQSKQEAYQKISDFVAALAPEGSKVSVRHLENLSYVGRKTAETEIIINFPPEYDDRQADGITHDIKNAVASKMKARLNDGAFSEVNNVTLRGDTGWNFTVSGDPAVIAAQLHNEMPPVVSSRSSTR